MTLQAKIFYFLLTFLTNLASENHVTIKYNFRIDFDVSHRVTLHRKKPNGEDRPKDTTLPEIRYDEFTVIFPCISQSRFVVKHLYGISLLFFGFSFEQIYDLLAVFMRD